MCNSLEVNEHLLAHKLTKNFHMVAYQESSKFKSGLKPVTNLFTAADKLIVAGNQISLHMCNSLEVNEHLLAHKLTKNLHMVAYQESSKFKSSFKPVTN